PQQQRLPVVAPRYAKQTAKIETSPHAWGRRQHTSSTTDALARCRIRGSGRFRSLSSWAPKKPPSWLTLKGRRRLIQWRQATESGADGGLVGITCYMVRPTARVHV